MIPVPLIVGVVAAGYAVWRGLGPRKTPKPGPHNNWRNEDYVSREERARRKAAREAIVAQPSDLEPRDGK